MNTQAIQIVQHCLDTRDPYLDLGRLGLTDADFAAGTPLDTLLRQCTHLETLILSNSWYQWDAEGEYEKHKSHNNGGRNTFNAYPPALSALTCLLTLIMAGEGNDEWGISDMGFLAGFSSLQQLHLGYNLISEVCGLKDLAFLQQLDLKVNQITDIRGLEGLSSLRQLNLESNQINEICGLKTLSSLQQLNLGYNQISEISGLERLSSLNRLNLSSNKISESSGLRSLSSLQQLDLSYNKISEISGLESFFSLQQLDLSYNKISEVKGLDGLVALSSLYLWGNQISEIKGLDSLTGLETLTLYSNQITEIKGLDSQTALKTLKLHNNQISEIKGLDSLTAMTVLDLSSNQISEIKGLDSLTALTVLDFSSNQISEIKGLDSLTALKTLKLHNNQISEIKGLDSLTALETLTLYSNKITEIKGLDSQTELKTLTLYYNKITEIKGLDSLTALTALDFSSNQITEIKELEKMATLTDLKLFNNPLRDMPPELAGEDVFYNCIRDCRNWWAETANPANTQQNTLVKLQLIGNGGVGKTSLLQALEKGRCQEECISTHGVLIRPLSFQVPGDAIQFRTWDFGGQEIYHGTHRLFLGSQAVQVIITASEAEQCAREGKAVADRIDEQAQVMHQPLPHYISLCRRYSANSQLLVVQNKVEQDADKDAEARKTAADAGIDFYTVSARQGHRIESLRNTIAELGRELPHYNMVMPKSWLAVRDYFLANIDKPAFERMRLLQYKDFEAVCEDKKVMPRSIPSLLRLLHQTGIVYTHKELLGDTIIADMDWALEAIYKPLERGKPFYNLMQKDLLGRVRVQTLFAALGDNYSVNQQWLFLGFMQSCGLCFALHDPSLPDKSLDRYYIFPQFLPPAATPAVEDAWAGAAEVQTFYCTLPYLDYYRIQQFIVALGNKTPVQYIWKNGILVTTTQGRFKVTANQLTNTLQVQIEQKATVAWLPYIIDTFQKGASQQNKEIWMQGNDADNPTPLDVEALRRQAAQKEQPSGTKHALPKLQQDFDEAAPAPGKELPDVPQQGPKRLVISYASEDGEVVKDLKRHLDDYIENGQLQLLYDKEVEDGKRFWDDRIKEMFNNADGFLMLVSQYFQNTAEKIYIWQDEVPLIEKRHEMEKIFAYCVSVRPVKYKQRLLRFDAYERGKKVLPENSGHEREAFLIDFTEKVIGKIFLNL